jgi:hypothetical protein
MSKKLTFTNAPVVLTDVGTGVETFQTISGSLTYTDNPPPPTRVQDWVNRVIANGGVQPAEATITAVGHFSDALDAASLSSSILSMLVFVPDSLTAALTPLFKVAGADPYSNIGGHFVGTDLTVNGLVGNGSNKNLDSGLIPFTAFADKNSGGMTLYNSTASNGSEQDAGCWEIGGNNKQIQLHISVGGTLVCDCWTDGTSRITAANSSFVGYTSMNRISANDYRVFRASSTVTHAQIGGTINSNDMDRPNVPVHVFSGYRNDSGAFSFSAKRFSLFAVHQGLTVAQSQAFFNAIQAFRTELGGGFI